MDMAETLAEIKAAVAEVAKHKEMIESGCLSFFDIEPAKNGGFHLCENGLPVARFDAILNAVMVRESIVAEIARTYELQYFSEIA
jgi:hypothetical protein